MNEKTINDFNHYLIKEELSELTIKNYISHLKHFLKWFEDSKGFPFSKLKRENILEYISFLKNIEKVKRGKNIGMPLSMKTVNAKISFLINFNSFLIDSGSLKKDEWLVTKKDLIRIQSTSYSYAKVKVNDIEKFRQLILEGFDSTRNFTIVTILAYAGLRISEALNLKVDDVNITGREIVVRKGKRQKFRKVFMNDKIANALKGWFIEREEKKIDSDFLFISKRGNRLDNTVINRMFNEYSPKIDKEITPHDLRHFFCTYLLDNGFSLHEVKDMAGHENIHTTIIYGNPSEDDMKEKMKNL